MAKMQQSLQHKQEDHAIAPLPGSPAACSSPRRDTGEYASRRTAPPLASRLPGKPLGSPCPCLPPDEKSLPWAARRWRTGSCPAPSRRRRYTTAELLPARETNKHRHHSYLCTLGGFGGVYVVCVHFTHNLSNRLSKMGRWPCIHFLFHAHAVSESRALRNPIQFLGPTTRLFSAAGKPVSCGHRATKPARARIQLADNTTVTETPSLV